jgi:hypothetical protein
MAGVMNDPEAVAYEECAFYEEKPQARVAYPGFWHTMVEYVRRHRARNACRSQFSSHISRHPIEMPMEWLAREHLTLYHRVFTGL